MSRNVGAFRLRREESAHDVQFGRVPAAQATQLFLHGQLVVADRPPDLPGGVGEAFGGFRPPLSNGSSASLHR
jgi:hypothetical protein